ncbi:MAG: tetratricopeptide repeat protein [Deltaproteobacteria bacterium]|jgi:tetratricopeptide (TPR) repeat protein|nr:tetratricopeptide repeat protein [Deltaproteobacteria bacterium]MBT4642008.1 tetratricopeptide repeat protein [Deltaproteobacteria bacterium]MBT6499592.1 tetratricopeptide repeat protein [Deltaproteobacteria bacterium]MBT7151451.1 tetratricopeptide repeat protein [Deltaproteobacteria bacterium]MBT7712718.1 tetratricopeptide repeat protein [Deltaproteobacteria bacterium]
MSQNLQNSERPRLIVLPLTPVDGQAYNGLGLGIHFLLGNVVAVHTGLKEFWFGWRVKKIFPEQEKLLHYCRGEEDLQQISDLASEQGIQYWLSGSYAQKKETVSLELTLTEVGDVLNQSKRAFELQLSDQVIGFRKAFLGWLDASGLPMSEDQATIALWSENISQKGLDCMGRAMETTYVNFLSSAADSGLINLHWFDQAISASPGSYLAWDVKGWALYKNKDYQAALNAFNAAIEINQKGLGALSGLMWCHIYANDVENAVKYAIAKADVRNESREKARASALNKVRKIFP